MGFEKLTFTPLTQTPLTVDGQTLPREVRVLFNPNSYTISKNVIWNKPTPSSPPSGSTAVATSSADRQLDALPLTFGGGDSRQLSLELFFDVTESNSKIKDVRQETDQIVKLTRIVRELQHPPIVRVTWGTSRSVDFPFDGVISSLTQRFTLFRSTGEPLRATLNVNLTEYLEPERNLRETDPALTTRVIKRGDTLSGITSELYRDPTQWRIIAEENQLDNPLRLEIGRRLTIPEF